VCCGTQYDGQSAVVAILLGFDPHGGTSYWISLGFTFFGAFIFALARMRRAKATQSTFITRGSSSTWCVFAICRFPVEESGAQHLISGSHYLRRSADGSPISPFFIWAEGKAGGWQRVSVCSRRELCCSAPAAPADYAAPAAAFFFFAALVFSVPMYLLP
jgi:hypothetical protein